jgi:hypothetical protein
MGVLVLLFARHAFHSFLSLCPSKETCQLANFSKRKADADIALLCLATLVT